MSADCAGAEYHVVFQVRGGTIMTIGVHYG